MTKTKKGSIASRAVARARAELAASRGCRFTIVITAEFTLGGPVYQCEIYCPGCGEAYVRDVVLAELEDPAGARTVEDFLDLDTDDFPQPVFFGEADGPQYCADCGEYLYGPQEADEEDEYDDNDGKDADPA